MVGGIVDGKYRLLRLLGEGGMGSVFEAEPIPNGSEAAAGEPGAARGEPRVAIKLIRPDRRDSSSLPRFHREARAASAIDTEHIVQVLGFGTDPETGAPYMVMELLEGEDLDVLLDRVGTLAPDAVLRIAAQVCRALENAHRSRVIHRDIKPANIFLARRPSGDIVVKLLDFGLAKIKPGPGDLTSGLTRSGGMMGSPRYMSPEQAKGVRGIDFRTDLWSLGMVLYHAITGKPPHHEARSLGQLILALCTSPPRIEEEALLGMSPGAASLIHRALELEPEDRFESATVMLGAIMALLPEGCSLHEGLLRQ